MSEMYQPSMTDIIRKACEIAEADPDHMYSAGPSGACVYVASPRTGSEACLFGQAYAAYGIPEDPMRRLCRVAVLHNSLANMGLVLPATDQEVGAATEAQRLQDIGERWGEVAARMRSTMGWEDSHA